jgi:hypothetical protein
MDYGPPRPVLRANLTIACDDLGVPAIASPLSRREPTLDRIDSPKDSFAVRMFLDTLQHELIARPALVALRHDVRWNTNTTHLIYIISGNDTVNRIKHCLFHNVNESLDPVHQQHTA